MPEGRRRLHRPAQRRRPADVAADRAERVEVAVFAAEVDGAADHQRRGLGPPRQRLFPDDPAGVGVELDDVARDQVDDVEAVLGVGRRGGVEATDPALPDRLAGIGVERVGPAAVVDEVEAAVDVDRRELEQGPVGEAPEFAEGRLDPLHRQVAGAGAVVAEHRPVDGLSLSRPLRGLLRLFRLEGDRGVVDVAGALQQLVADRRGTEDERGGEQGDHREAVALDQTRGVAKKRCVAEAAGLRPALRHAWWPSARTPWRRRSAAV